MAIPVHAVPQPSDLVVSGIPERLPPGDAAVLRSRLLNAVTAGVASADLPDLLITVGAAPQVKRAAARRGPGGDTPAVRFSPRPPSYTFDQLVVPDETRSTLLASVRLLGVETRVFDDWGLRSIEPHPRTALNFHGPPGTGKTLAAHALADYLGLPLLAASYAEIESKYHGDGPKNVQRLFAAAEETRSVLFVDEADSLLSRRLTDVTQGSEQAINSMRSQLLICLEQYRGVVIFATNLVQNYDEAFGTRVRHVAFVMPDEPTRAAIWRRHLPPQLPLGADVGVDVLARETESLCGRDIKNAVIDAAVRVAVDGGGAVTLEDLRSAVQRIRDARIPDRRALSGAERRRAERSVRDALAAARLEQAPPPSPPEERPPEEGPPEERPPEEGLPG